MDKVLGKYLDQPDNDFPLDCETFDYIQNNNFITEMIGNIAGDKCFIYGCEKSGTDNYAPGYVFLRTANHPEGEILPFVGGRSSGKVYINSQEESVTVNGKTYSAYTKRSLSLFPTVYDNTGYDLNEFTYASYNQPLYGEIKIWSGPVDKIPPGYHICDGTALKISEYPNLYNVIRDMYNKQHIGSHYTYIEGLDYYTTEEGYFRVPDLTARFIVGCDSSGNIPGDDINGNGYAFGSQGGLSTCRLTNMQSGLPAHNHLTKVTMSESGVHRHWYAAHETAADQRITAMGPTHYAEMGVGPGGRGGGGIQETSASGGHTHSFSVTVNYSEVRNASESHENKPPFMVLCYIIRCC